MVGRNNGHKAAKWNKEDTYPNSRPSGTRAVGGETASPGNCCWREQCPWESDFYKRKRVEGTFWEEDSDVLWIKRKWWRIFRIGKWIWGEEQRGRDLVRFCEMHLSAVLGRREWCVYIHIFICAHNKFRCLCLTYYMCDCKFNYYILLYLIISIIKLGF